MQSLFLPTYGIRNASTRATTASLASRLLPPLLAFVVVRMLLAWVAHQAGFDSTSAQTWSRWDSGHYVWIADGGYKFYSCRFERGQPPDAMCGNTAWLPGYPALIHAVSWTGLSLKASGVIVSAFFGLGTLMLLWNTFLGPELKLRSVLTLALAALFPGNVYYAAIFPISMCTFFSLLAIRYYISERFLNAGIAGCIAAFSYSTGMFLAVVFGLHLLFWRRHESLGRRALESLCAAGLTAAGFLLFVVIQRLQIGVWDAYSQVQSNFHYTFTWPWRPIAAQVRGALSPGNPVARHGAFVLLLAGLFFWAASKKPRRPLDAVLALYALIFWLVPLMLGPGYPGVVRAQSMLLPAVPLARLLPVWVLVGVILLALLCMFSIGPMFFRSEII